MPEAGCAAKKHRQHPPSETSADHPSIFLRASFQASLTKAQGHKLMPHINSDGFGEALNARDNLCLVYVLELVAQVQDP